jgi:TadE-like protein
VRKNYKAMSGAMIVEMAISLLVFLIILLGTIDIALLMFKMVKGVDVARETARQLIVDEPLTPLSVLNGCDVNSEFTLKTTPVQCSGDCDDYAERLLSDYSVGDIVVTYGCSGAGRLARGANDPRLLIPQVRVDVLVRYSFLFSEILFGEDSLTVTRTFSVTRTGEDIDTV